MHNSPHSFHIPVMGTSFTVDTPLKVAKYGISSVIPLVDDVLLEKMRKYYCEQYQMSYNEISHKEYDHRAKRTTAYLNLINELVELEFNKLKSSSFEDENSEIVKYFEMLPDKSELKGDYLYMQTISRDAEKSLLREKLRNKMVKGSIDVNIMTKVDRANYKKKHEPLPIEFNDAHATLRGFAQSDLASSLILSAGMNPRLYSYIEQFDDFYPDTHGSIKKKIVLKVSDYRSAIIQGKFLAKKGLWVSEYRIESGLNCGGHAFATEGHLLGPILEEFKRNRENLIETTFSICKEALYEKGHAYSGDSLPLSITVQGGIGNNQEHNFLLRHYEVNSTGWGTPFLLVPEATTVDDQTLELLAKAQEEDLYLSDKSPLGVPFNSIRGNTKDIERQQQIEKDKSGSSCPRKYLALNSEFTKEPICTASRKYQQLKLTELDSKTMSSEQYAKVREQIEVKECICTGLAASAFLKYRIATKGNGSGVSICPGPNLAYFSKIVSLKDMVKHIYGQLNIVASPDRPNMFVKELKMYVDYLKDEIDKAIEPITDKKIKYFESFKNNLLSGIDYYQDLLETMKEESLKVRGVISAQLSAIEKEIQAVLVLNNSREVTFSLTRESIAKVCS